jgi:hypothetical protein
MTYVHIICSYEEQDDECIITDFSIVEVSRIPRSCFIIILIVCCCINFVTYVDFYAVPEDIVGIRQLFSMGIGVKKPCILKFSIPHFSVPSAASDHFCGE